jgi:diadenosine tetraphosphate (Ap4A) HIT family hydrolase
MDKNTQNCLVCERISWIKNNSNPFFVKEVQSGYIVLGDYQFYEGYTLLLSRIHVDELHKLSKVDRSQFLEDMAHTAEALYKAFKPKKLNYELLGNTDSHLHWHLFPRYEDDPKPNTAIWAFDKSIRSSEEQKPSEAKLNDLKQRLLDCL